MIGGFALGARSQYAVGCGMGGCGALRQHVERRKPTAARPEQGMGKHEF
jgi:hypothetical protein